MSDCQENKSSNKSTEILFVFLFVILSTTFIISIMYIGNKIYDHLNPKLPTESFYTVGESNVSHKCYKNKWDMHDKSITEECDSGIMCLKGVEYLNGSFGGLVQLTDKNKNPIQCAMEAVSYYHKADFFVWENIVLEIRYTH